MGLGLIPYQPLPFGLEPNCTLPCANWIQKIERGDRTSMQFTFGACGNTGSILTNGNFASGSTGWTVNGTWVFAANVASSPIGGSGYIQQSITGAAGLYYELSFDLTLYNGVLILSSNLGITQTFYVSGGQTLIFDSDGMTNLNFYFPEALGGTLSNILLKPVSTDVAVDVVDLDDVVVDSISDEYFTFTGGYLTVSIESWAAVGLADGCYKLAIYDPCQCSQFGFIGDDFDTPNQFAVTTNTVSTTVTITGGDMDVVNGGAVAGSVVVQKLAALCPDVSYTVTYTVSGLAASDNFRTSSGLTNGILRTADGTYTETLTVTANNDTQQGLRFVFGLGAVGGLHTITITDFSIEAVEPVVAWYSEPFNLKDDHKCTLLIEACGDSDQFNFGFNQTGFKPTIRLEGTYRGGGHPMSKTGYEYSSGTKDVPYMRTRKSKTLMFGAPEYVHDFAVLWLGFSNVFIDGVLKASDDDDEPTVALEEDYDFGIVTYQFSDKTELTEKTSCNPTKGISCSSDYTDAQQGYSITVPSTGGITISSRLATGAGQVILINSTNG